MKIPKLQEARCHTTARQKGPLCLLTRCTGVMRRERERGRERERERARARGKGKRLSASGITLCSCISILHCIAVFEGVMVALLVVVLYMISRFMDNR